MLFIQEGFNPTDIQQSYILIGGCLESHLSDCFSELSLFVILNEVKNPVLVNVV